MQHFGFKGLRLSQVSCVCTDNLLCYVKCSTSLLPFKAMSLYHIIFDYDPIKLSFCLHQVRTPLTPLSFSCCLHQVRILHTRGTMQEVLSTVMAHRQPSMQTLPLPVIPTTQCFHTLLYGVVRWVNHCPGDTFHTHQHVQLILVILLLPSC